MRNVSVLLLEHLIGSFIAMVYYGIFLIIMIRSFYFSDDPRNRQITSFIRHSTLFFVSTYSLSFFLFIFMDIHAYGTNEKSAHDLAYLSSKEYLIFYVISNFTWLISRISFYILFMARFHYTFRNSIYQSSKIVYILLFIGLFIEFLLLTFVNIYVFALGNLDKNYQLILYLTIGVLSIDSLLALSILFLFVSKLFLLIVSRTQDLVSGKIDSKKYQREMSKSALSYEDLRASPTYTTSSSIIGNNGNRIPMFNATKSSHTSPMAVPITRSPRSNVSRRSPTDENHDHGTSISIADTPKRAPSYVALRGSFRLSPNFGGKSLGGGGGGSINSVSTIASPETMGAKILQENTKDSDNVNVNDSDDKKECNKSNNYKYLRKGKKGQKISGIHKESVGSFNSSSSNPASSSSTHLLSPLRLNSSLNFSKITANNTNTNNTNSTNNTADNNNNNNNKDSIANEKENNRHTREASPLQLNLNNSLSISRGSPVFSKLSFSMSSRHTMRNLWQAIEPLPPTSGFSGYGSSNRNSIRNGSINISGYKKVSISIDKKRLVAKLDGKAIILINTVAQQTLLSTIAMISSIIYFLVLAMNFWDKFSNIEALAHILTIYRCIDRMIAVTCVYLGFRFSKKAYKMICRKQHQCCKYCCEKVAKRSLKKRYTRNFNQTQLAEYLLSQPGDNGDNGDNHQIKEEEQEK